MSCTDRVKVSARRRWVVCDFTRIRPRHSYPSIASLLIITPTPLSRYPLPPPPAACLVDHPQAGATMGGMVGACMGTLYGVFSVVRYVLGDSDGGGGGGGRRRRRRDHGHGYHF